MTEIDHKGFLEDMIDPSLLDEEGRFKNGGVIEFVFGEYTMSEFDMGE